MHGGIRSVVMSTGLALLLGMAAGATGLPGCSGDGGAVGGPGSVKTGLPGDKVLGDLGPADRQTFCDAMTAWGMKLAAPDNAALFCRLSGVGNASDAEDDQTPAQACQEGVDECLADFGDPGGGECNPPDESCTATVAEFESCFSEAVNGLWRMLGQLPTCDDVTGTASDWAGITQPMLSPGCEEILDTCGGPGNSDPSTGGSNGGGGTGGA